MQETVYNPQSKERIVFRESTDEVFSMDLYVEPGGGIRAPDHIHPRQEERLRVVAGSARFRVDGEERTASAGEIVTVPIGLAHTWENAGDEELHLDVTYRPGLKSARTFFRTYFRWAQQGMLEPDGRPPLMDWAVLFRETQDFIAIAKVPLPVQRVLAGLLAPIARRRGHQISAAPYRRSGRALAPAPTAGARNRRRVSGRASVPRASARPPRARGAAGRR